MLALFHLRQLELANGVVASHRLISDQETSFKDAVDQRRCEDLVDRVVRPRPVVPLKPSKSARPPQNSFSKPSFASPEQLPRAGAAQAQSEDTLRVHLGLDAGDAFDDRQSVPCDFSASGREMCIHIRGQLLSCYLGLERAKRRRTLLVYLGLVVIQANHLETRRMLGCIHVAPLLATKIGAAFAMHVDVDHPQRLPCQLVISLKLGVLQRSEDALTNVTLDGIQARRGLSQKRQHIFLSSNTPTHNWTLPRGLNDAHLVLSRDRVTDERVSLFKIGYVDAAFDLGLVTLAAPKVSTPSNLAAPSLALGRQWHLAASQQQQGSRPPVHECV